MSSEAEQNALAPGRAVLETWRDSVKRARPKANVGPVPAQTCPEQVQAAGGDLAKASLKRGLVEPHRRPQAFQARLQQLGGTTLAPPAASSASSSKSYIEETVDTRACGQIGVVTVAGMIVDGEASRDRWRRHHRSSDRGS
jgi:protease-4